MSKNPLTPQKWGMVTFNCFWGALGGPLNITQNPISASFKLHTKKLSTQGDFSCLRRGLFFLLQAGQMSPTSFRKVYG